MADRRTPGERAFEEYLDVKGWKWVRAEGTRGKRHDYDVNAGRVALHAEVKDVGFKEDMGRIWESGGSLQDRLGNRGMSADIFVNECLESKQVRDLEDLATTWRSYERANELGPVQETRMILPSRDYRKELAAFEWENENGTWRVRWVSWRVEGGGYPLTEPRGVERSDWHWHDCWLRRIVPPPPQRLDILEVTDFSSPVAELVVDSRSIGLLVAPGETGDRDRVRDKISDAAKQLPRPEEGRASIVVIYGEVYPVDLGGEVIAACEGNIEVRFNVGTRTSVPSRPVYSGEGAVLRGDKNTRVSAVGTLSRAQDGLLRMEVYHNRFAANPLSPGLFEAEYKCGERGEITRV